MKVGILDSSMRIMEGDKTCNTFYMEMVVNEIFDYHNFVNAAINVIEQIPSLHAKLKKGFWRDHWCIKEVDCEQYFYKMDVTIQGNDEVEELQKKFLISEEKYLRVTEDYPIKFLFFKGKEKGLLVFAFQHVLCDGIGALQLISQIMKSYKAHERGEKVVINTAKKNPIRNISKRFGRINLMKNFAYMKPKDYLKETKIIMDMERDAESEIDYTRLKIATCSFKQDELEKAKKFFKDEPISLHDIFLCCGLRVLAVLNEEKGVNNRGISLTYLVNLRRYLNAEDLEKLYMSNIFTPQAISHDVTKGTSPEELMRTVLEMKDIPIGLPFYAMINIMNAFPVVFMEKIIGHNVNNIDTQAYQGISISNIGKVDTYLEGMENVIEEFSLIGAGTKNGLPSISISGYQGKVTIHIFKYHDEEDMTLEILEKFQNELKNLIECIQDK